MLNGKLVLHDIRDVEAWALSFIDRFDLSYHDREDLLAYLVESTWELSEQFRPGKAGFSTWAGNILRRRVADLDRKNFRTRWVFSDGRTYERAEPVLVSLDSEPRGDSGGLTLRDRVSAPDSRADGLSRLLGTRHLYRTGDRRHITETCIARSAA